MPVLGGPLQWRLRLRLRHRVDWHTLHCQGLMTHLPQWWHLCQQNMQLPEMLGGQLVSSNGRSTGCSQLDLDWSSCTQWTPATAMPQLTQPRHLQQWRMQCLSDRRALCANSRRAPKSKSSAAAAGTGKSASLTASLNPTPLPEQHQECCAMSRLGQHAFVGAPRGHAACTPRLWPVPHRHPAPRSDYWPVPHRRSFTTWTHRVCTEALACTTPAILHHAEATGLNCINNPAFWTNC
jgi:hypothetical protein